MTPLTLLHQDEFLVAIDKPAGMLVHPGREPEGNEWIAMKCLRDQLGRRVFPIHRLDRPTTGVLLFALDKHSAALAQQAFERRQVTKIYHAIVEGMTPERWDCDRPLQEIPDEPFLSAQTSFKRIRSTTTGGLHLSWIQAQPSTGRFHQIRRHLKDCGFPIVGDFRYAGQERSFEIGEILGIGTRMLLQAKSLTLMHPCTGEPLHVEAPVDTEFLKCFPGDF